MATGTASATNPCLASHRKKPPRCCNPPICRELCLPFPWQAFLGSQSKAFVRLSRLAFDCWLVTQAKNSRLPQKEDTMTPTIATQRSSEQTTDKNAIRPFHVNVPEAELADLRQRLAQTRLPDNETVTDYSQG